MERHQFSVLSSHALDTLWNLPFRIKEVARQILLLAKRLRVLANSRPEFKTMNRGEQITSTDDA